MATEKEIQRLEKEIFSKMIAIKSKKITPAESGIGRLFTILKKMDEVSYQNYMDRYKRILIDIKNG